MSAIELNRLLVLERQVRLSDGAGGFQRNWTEVGSLWAEVTPGTGRDAGGVEVVLTSVPYRITVRGAPVGSERRPLPEQRFREGSRIFHILAVTERDPQGHYLICHAREERPV
jgi:head-tail adaptor